MNVALIMIAIWFGLAWLLALLVGRWLQERFRLP
jgi:hypothetical protein